MIDSDETGQKKWTEVIRAWREDESSWSHYEARFISGNYGNTYSNLTPKQKALASDLYERMMSK